MARIVGSNDNETLVGTSGNDLVFGASGRDTLYGGAGDDVVYAYGTGSSATNALSASLVATGFSSPLFLAQADDGTDRGFVVEKGGLIKILDLATGNVDATPFLDISASISTDSERGLLGLAFHPDFATNGLFYVDFTLPNGDIRISEFKVSDSNPDVADAASERALLTIPHSTHAAHNGGWIGFGPDGYLHIATGDGGTGGEPSQNRESLLGKILRIDVDSRTGTLPYGIPADNPFVGTAGADEIWAYGLRNPWRNSFDSFLGDFWIADVGQDLREEINFHAHGAAGGQNYGWNILEGTSVYTPGIPTTGMTAPIYEYVHGASNSITGGYVYRGAADAYTGDYFFADLITNTISTLRPVDGAHIKTDLIVTPDSGNISNIVSFGQDRSGAIYTIGIGGAIHRLDISANTADAGGMIDGGTGRDQLFGGDGDDTIVFDAMDDLDNVLGGNGNDTLLIYDSVAPISFSLGAHGFEMARTENVDTAAEPWSTNTRYYDINWLLTQQYVTYENGTALRNGYAGGLLDYMQEYAANGVLERYTDYDQANLPANTWTYTYNLYDGVTSVQTQKFTQYDNGASSRQGYDSQGRIDWLQEYAANGTLERYTDYDQAGDQPFLSFYNLYNPANGLQTQKFVLYDNNTSLRQGFDSAGRLDWQEERRADNTLAFYTDWDQNPADNNPWTYYINYHNAAGTLYARHIFYDNGTDIWI